MGGPTEEEKENLLLSCRYGDIDDVRDFANNYGKASLDLVRDNNANTVLHMTAGNGHLDLLDFLLSIVSPSLLSAQNNSGSTALHWAAINAQLEVAQKLIQFHDGPGSSLIDIKNAAGRSPLAEAEMAGWDEGAKYMVQVMNIDETAGSEGPDTEDTDSSNAGRDIDIEIQDADGQVARMTIRDDAKS